MQKENIKNRLGCTQEEMALLLEIPRSQWSMYESGKRNLPLQAKQKLTALLTATTSNKTSSKKVQKIVATQNKAAIQELQKTIKETQYLLELTEQKIKIAEKMRHQSFAALQLISLIEKMPQFTDTKSVCAAIQARSEKQLNRYSEKYVMHLQLKKETINHQMNRLTKKIKSYTNDAPSAIV